MVLSPEELEKRLEELPEEIQEFLYSPEMYTAIKQVSAKHQLHVDQMDILASETSQVLLGVTKTEEFPQTIAQSLKIAHPAADAIAKDLNDLLFAKIRGAMKRNDEHLSQKKEEKSVIMPSQAAAVAAKLPAAAPVSNPATVPIPTSPFPIAAPPPTTAKPVPQPNAEARNPSQPPKTDLMLKEPSVSLPPSSPPSAKSEPPKPTAYKTDPYREPVG